MFGYHSFSRENMASLTISEIGNISGSNIQENFVY